MISYISCKEIIKPMINEWILQANQSVNHPTEQIRNKSVW